MKIMIMALPTSGGLAHYCSHLANALAKRSSVTVLMPSQGPENFYLDTVDIQLFQAKRVYKKWPSASTYLKLYTQIKKIDPDIIHDPAVVYWSSILKPFLKRWPLVTTLHDPRTHSKEATLFQLLQAFNNKIELKTSDLIFTHGKFCKKLVMEQGFPKENIQIIPHGPFTLLNQDRTNIREEKDLVLFFGRMRLNKGVDRLIDIAERVRNKIPEVKLLVAGSGQASRLRRNSGTIRAVLARMKSHELFEVHDRYIPDGEVEIFFRRASTVLLPYYDATQSGIVPLAFMFKKPVIATKVGDLTSIVEDGVTGYLADPESNKDIAAKLIRLLKNDARRRKMGQKAYEKCKDTLSWDNVAVETLKAYDQIL